ncbi:protoporphyrinogen oxidase [Seiridium cupressi]
MEIAIVGGGITGLITAYYAAHRFRSAHITIFEASSRLGGSIESTRLDVSSGSQSMRFLCEKGPRTLRVNAPRAAVTYELIQSLGLTSECLAVPNDSPVAGTRYILYPKHLVGLPAVNSPAIRHVAFIPAPSRLGLSRMARYCCLIATEPLLRNMIPGAFRDVFIARRPEGLRDESIGQFVTRRWGSDFTDNFLSAIIHGLYAGDINQLSVKSLMPKMWELEKQAEIHKRRWGPLIGMGGVLREMMCKDQPEQGPLTVGTTSLRPFSSIIAATSDALCSQTNHHPLEGLRERLRNASVFSFKEGMESLPLALANALWNIPNVNIRLDENVTDVKTVRSTTNLQLSIDDKPQRYDRVIVTTPLRHLKTIIPSLHPFSGIESPAVTVMVVTLCYATLHLNHPYQGFGYLIPQSVPLHWNPEKALGIIFDSDAMPGQDIGTTGTKITVVIGGHWWNANDDRQLPNEEQGTLMARTLLKRHLGVTQVPIVSIATLRAHAIPQYTVGHSERMRDLHRSLRAGFDGRLRVAGCSYRGIGVHDCIFSAKSVVESLGADGLTGLESFDEG